MSCEQQEARTCKVITTMHRVNVKPRLWVCLRYFLLYFLHFDSSFPGFSECSLSDTVINIFHKIPLAHILLNILHTRLLRSTSGFYPRYFHLRNISQYFITLPPLHKSIPSQSAVTHHWNKRFHAASTCHFNACNSVGWRCAFHVPQHVPDTALQGFLEFLCEALSFHFIQKDLAYT